MRLTPKEHVTRQTKTGVYIMKKTAMLDRMRSDAHLNMLWLSPLCTRELFNDIIE